MASIGINDNGMMENMMGMFGNMMGQNPGSHMPDMNSMMNMAQQASQQTHTPIRIPMNLKNLKVITIKTLLEIDYEKIRI